MQPKRSQHARMIAMHLEINALLSRFRCGRYLVAGLEQELHQMCHMCLIAHFAHAAARNSLARCPICRVLLNPALGAVDEVPTPGPYTEAYSLLSQFAEGKGIVKMRISESRSRFKILLPQQPDCVGAFNGVQKATASTVLTAARQCRGRIGGYLTQFTNVPVHKAKICKSLSYM